MCACVLTMALTVSLCRPRRSSMRFTSSPGSTTSASCVTGSPMIEQLHCNIPTGMVIWINPSVAALRTGRPLLMKGSIPSAMKGFAAGAASPPRTTSSAMPHSIYSHFEAAQGVLSSPTLPGTFIPAVSFFSPILLSTLNRRSRPASSISGTLSGLSTANLLLPSRP